MEGKKAKQRGRERLERNRLSFFLGLGLALGIFLGGIRTSRAEEPPKKEPPPIDKSLNGLKFGLLAYIDYSAGDQPLPQGQEQHYNRFTLTRGYVTLEKKFTPRLGARVTLDLSEDKEDKLTIDDSGTSETYKLPNDLEGSYMIRVKYYYAIVLFPDVGPLTNMKAEVGMGHIPWLDFEEHVNPYRCQGTMAIERAGVFNSADLGVSLMGYFGGELEDAQAKTGNKHYAGRYGSWHLGIYNGSGYHATEKNQNKVFEGRVTLRPLPDLIPGLQVSYFYLSGEGNTKYTFKKDDYWPYYRVQMGMLSYEHPALTFTGQYFVTDGNAKGTWVYGKKAQALRTEGYSYFLRVKMGGSPLWLLGRYDYFNIDPEHKLIKNGETAYTMTMYGLAYDLHEGNLIMIVYESTDYQEDADVKTKLPVAGNDLGHENRLQLVWQIKL